jgi:hypothetical protein
MMTHQWYDDNRYRLSKGLPEIRKNELPSLDELMHSEWSEEFDNYAKGKMIMGAYRYGVLRKNNRFDFMAAMSSKIQLYHKTHNLELLVDIRNYAMLEFLKPGYADAYYYNEDDTEHAPLKL